MSADNWRICPRCKWQTETKQRLAVKKAEALYGKVSPQAYTKLIRDAETQPELKETLREDFAVYTSPDGVFRVSYRACCNRCGFKHYHQCEERLDVRDAATEEG